MPKRIENRAGALLLLTAVAACGDAQVELSLLPNKFLILPFATAEVAGERLKIVATNLFRLGAGQRYLCWLGNTAGGQPPRYIGELQGGQLTVDEASLGAKLADHDRLSCTVESQASPAQPSLAEVLRGEPGGLLVFGGESLTTELGEASASCRIDGMRADFSYQGLPGLPPGFRYGFYLKGVLLDPAAALGVASTHQHLAEGASGGGERMILLRWLETLPSGDGVFWERSGGNLTGHRQALLSIEASGGDGLPTIFPLAAPDGSAPAAQSAPGPAPQPAGSYQVKMEVSPADVHVGEVASFLFRVSQNGSPVSGLVPSASFQDLSGKGGNIVLEPGPEPGSYAGSKAFFSAGQHRIQFTFNQSGQDYSTSFDVTIQQH